MKRRAASETPQTMPKWAGLALAALVLIGSAGTVVTVILAGHSGAKAVWCDERTPELLTRDSSLSSDFHKYQLHG